MESSLRAAALSICAVFILACSGTDDGQQRQTGRGGTTPADTDSFRVGISVKDITPSRSQIESGAIHLGGYGYLGIRDFDMPAIMSEATGVHDQLLVRAMVIELDGKAFALAVIDAAGIGNRILREIKSTAGEATDLKERDIYIANTHSHNAPDLQGYCGGVSEAYRSLVIDHTVAVISEAKSKLVDANLYISSAQGRAGNRRGWGYTDTSIPVLEARAKGNNETLGALINFGCHPTVLNPGDTELSRDYVGFLIDYAEAQLGAPVVFVQGALGDATPDTRGLEYDSGFEVAQAFGESMAKEVLASMKNQTLVEPELYLDSYTFKHSVSNPLLMATYLLLGTQLEYDIEFDLFDGLSLETQVGYARLGKQVQMALLPGESLTSHALSIKESMSVPFRMVLCQAGDSLGYLIPTDEWESAPNGVNYEETFAFDRFLGDTSRDHLVEMIGYDSGLREEIEIQAGFSQRVITPQDIESWTDENNNGEKDSSEPYVDLNGNGKFDGTYLAGFGMNHPANGVHDDIYVVAAVLDDGNKRLGLVAIDCIGWMIEEVKDVREALPGHLEIDHLIMHATHDHEAPDTQGLWGLFNPAGKEETISNIKEQSIEALSEAVAGLAPADMYIGEVLDRDQELGVEDTRPHPYVLDEGVRIMVFRAKGDDRVVGTIVNWGNHAEVLWSNNLLITADYPGYLRRGISEGIEYEGETLREGLGGITMFLNGNIGGLVTTSPRMAVYDKYTGAYYLEPSFEKARALGYGLADIILDADRDDSMALNTRPNIRVYRDEFDIEIENEDLILAWSLGILRRDVDFLSMNTWTEVNLVTIGNLWLAAIPGELFPEIAVGGIENPPGADFDVAPVEVPALRAMMGGRVNFMVNLANDSIGYIIPLSEWDEEKPWLNDDPEETYGEDNSLGPNTAPRIHSKLMHLMERAGS